MGRHAQTKGIIDAVYEVLAVNHPMTVRQVYYAGIEKRERNKLRKTVRALST